MVNGVVSIMASGKSKNDKKASKEASKKLVKKTKTAKKTLKQLRKEKEAAESLLNYCRSMSNYFAEQAALEGMLEESSEQQVGGNALCDKRQFPQRVPRVRGVCSRSYSLPQQIPRGVRLPIRRDPGDSGRRHPSGKRIRNSGILNSTFSSFFYPSIVPQNNRMGNPGSPWDWIVLIFSFGFEILSSEHARNFDKR